MAMQILPAICLMFFIENHTIDHLFIIDMSTALDSFKLTQHTELRYTLSNIERSSSSIVNCRMKI